MNLSPNLLKFLAVVLLFALWGALVFVGKADPAALVSAIGAVIAGLGVHGATAKPGAPAAVAPPPDVPAPMSEPK